MDIISLIRMIRGRLGTHSSVSQSSYLIEEDSINKLIEEDSLNKLIEEPYPTVFPVAPEPPAEPLSLNLYKGHGVLDVNSGLEPTVIIENGLVRVWYTGLDYTNASYAYGVVPELEKKKQSKGFSGLEYL